MTPEEIEEHRKTHEYFVVGAKVCVCGSRCSREGETGKIVRRRTNIITVKFSDPEDEISYSIYNLRFIPDKYNKYDFKFRMAKIVADAIGEPIITNQQIPKLETKKKYLFDYIDD